MKNRPSPRGAIEWHEAPAGTTHVYRGDGNSYWMRQMAHTWHYWSPISEEWKRDPTPAPNFHIARPNTDGPDDATHTQHSTDRMFKAGPNRHARVWSVYNAEPAWVCASGTLNEDLDDPTKFAPITREPLQNPTNSEVIFTMSAEESKAIALDKRPMQVVACVFSNESEAKEYHYFAPAEARAGQFAVVYANVQQNREFPFTVVKIVRDNVMDIGGKANKAILGTFDEDFAKHVQARMEHMARVKAQLQQKKKMFEENAIFEMLAQKDPEAAALLAELKEFQV